MSSGTRRARLRWRLLHGLEHYSRCAEAAVMFKSTRQSRKRSSRACSARRAEEQSCAELPDSIKLRDLSSPKVAALSSLVAMPYLVSSPALARHPSAHLLIICHPALAVLLRTAVARRGDALSSQAARQSCSCMRVCICSAGSVLTSRGAARQAESRRGSWCSRRRCGAWIGSWPR